MIRKIIETIESSNLIGKGLGKFIYRALSFHHPLLYNFIKLTFYIYHINKHQNLYRIKKYLNWKHKNPNISYKEFYCEHVSSAKNPKEIVGGIWDISGNFQFNFLLRNGLKPHHKLLDIGCGCLRGGLHFIQYLNKGNYYGIDISSKLLQEGRLFLSEAELEYKKPVLRVNIDLKFDDFRGEVFDYIFAHSVFTHITLHDIKECFENIHKVMNNKTLFFATFRDGGRNLFTPDYLTFYYPFNVFRNLGEKYNCQVTLFKNPHHPKGQKMIKITLKED